MPTGLCAATGMDALVHAVEGYITKGAWELTDMLHLKAIEIIGRSLRSAVAGDYAGREAMSLGQYIAGMGFSNVGLGIVSLHGASIECCIRYPSWQGLCHAFNSSIEIQCSCNRRKIS